MITTRLDMSGYRRLAARTIRELGTGTVRAVHESSIEGANYARANTRFKKRTGRLTGHELYARMDTVTPRMVTAEIRNDVPYARFVEYPTKPHQIWPKAGHGTTHSLSPGQSRREITDIGTHRVALRFTIGGRTVFARMVNHPGTPGFPFMEPAQRFAADKLRWRIGNVVFVAVASLWN